MLLMPLTTSHKEDVQTLLEGLHEIYVNAFPPEERRPWADVVQPVSSMGPHLSAIYLDGNDVQPVGLVTLWHFDTFSYIEHFAIAEECRGCGTGSMVLSELRAVCNRPIVLEVEKPETSSQATKRVHFYNRNGFKTVSTTYIQPPYAPGLPEVPLDIMASGDLLCSTAEVENKLRKHVYSVSGE